MKKKFYAAVTPSIVGIFTDWDKVSPLVSGIKGAQHEGFLTFDEAKAFIETRLSPEDRRDFGLDKNPIFFVNKTYVRLVEYIEAKNAKNNTFAHDKKSVKFYAVITPNKVGVFREWYKADELKRTSSKGKIKAFSDFDAAEGYLLNILSDKDFDDFGFNVCDLFVNKTYGRKSNFLARKKLEAAAIKEKKQKKARGSMDLPSNGS